MGESKKYACMCMVETRGLLLLCMSPHFEVEWLFICVVQLPRQSSRAGPVPSFRPEVSASALRPILPALGAFSVPLSQRATLRPHRRKKGSELV